MIEEVLRIEAQSNTRSCCANSLQLSVIRVWTQAEKGVSREIMASDTSGFEWSMGDQGVAGGAFVESYERLLST